MSLDFAVGASIPYANRAPESTTLALESRSRPQTACPEALNLLGEIDPRMARSAWVAVGCLLIASRATSPCLAHH